MGIGEVKSLPDFGTLNPQTQGEVVNVLTTAAVESLTKVPPTTFKDVVENAVKAMIQKAQDKTLMLGGNESTRHGSSVLKCEAWDFSLFCRSQSFC